MSSESARRRATPRPPHPSSPSPRRKNLPLTPRKLPDLSELRKASSEPLIPDAAVYAGDDCRSLVSDGCLYRSMNCSNDVFSPAPPLLSPRSLPEDSKVVVSVTVEGSPGPIRTLVKLSSSVDETIKLVIDEYAKEGRSPPLDTDAASHYELHLSYFSLESLDRSSAMGIVGSRTFYLRRSVAEITCVDEVISPPHQSCPLMLMCLADLEFDHINPYETATRINKIVLPEFITQGTLCFLYLITGYWVMLLLCIPYLYHNIKTYMDRQHLIDVTEIFNHLNWEKKKRLFKLGYLVLILFFSLFWLIWSALEDDEHML